MSDMYDLVVIGAGPGGYPAAIRGSQLGLKTACIEREKVGGVCLNWGCIPSKALLKTAELVQKLEHADDWGVKTGPVQIDYPQVIARSRKVAAQFERGVQGLFKKYGVTHIHGSASLTAPGQIRVEGSEGAREIAAKHVVIATGSRARVFPGMEVDGQRVVTYREAIVSESQPGSVTVIGAGAIGIEFAYFWNALGSDVTVIEALDEIVPLEDREIGASLRKELERQGIRFLLGQRVKSCAADGDQARTVLEDGTEIQANLALLALGIAPNVEDIGLDELGVKLDKGAIAVDGSYRTNVASLYAVGDVCALGPALAHTATRQAHVCVERIAGHHPSDVDYDAMPAATYCQPQVASVGLTEEQAKARGVRYKVGRFPFQANGKAVGAGTPAGFVKVLVDERYGELLGAHILGAEATEMISELVLARTAEATAELLAETVHPHPTSSEAAMEAVAQALNVGVHL